MAETFSIVWNPAGARPPSFRHPTQESAVAEAGRLAEANPGQSFFVLTAIGFASADAPQARFMSFVDDEAQAFQAVAPNDPPQIGGYLPVQQLHRIMHIDELTGDLNKMSNILPQMVGVTTLIVPDHARGPGIVRGHSAITAVVDRIVTESGRVLKDKNGAEGRVLKHGEYLPGDRVRFTGSYHDADQELAGRVGVFRNCDYFGATFVLDGETAARLCSIENLEHEGLPQSAPSAEAGAAA